jgi:hypothetical protein
MLLALKCGHQATPTLLRRQPKLWGGGCDPISLLLVVRKYVESARKHPFRQFRFSEHNARSNQ